MRLNPAGWRWTSDMMIDIHSHILPGVDDGSENFEKTLAMLEMACESGVSTIVATPHCMPGVYNNVVSEKLEDKWERFIARITPYEFPLRICRGMEVMLTDETLRLIRNKTVWPLNDSRYLLVEFAFDEDPEFCRKALKKVMEYGYVPVVAHPSRYYFVQSWPQIVYDWYMMGCAIQVNKGSLLGRFGRKEYNIAHSLLEHGLVTCVASDAHGARQRTTRMNELWEMLAERYGENYAYMLMQENPARILNNSTLVGYEPIAYED